MFGQSPAGFSTGEADLRNYYDGINSQQNVKLRAGVKRIYELLCRSELGIKVPDGFKVEFEPLWQLSAKEKAEIGEINTRTVLAAEAQSTVNHATALKELKGQSEETGVWTNITDDEIKEAEAEPPPLSETDLPNPPGPEEADASLSPTRLPPKDERLPDVPAIQ
jgi:hypothetical protein